MEATDHTIVTAASRRWHSRRSFNLHEAGGGLASARLSEVRAGYPRDTRGGRGREREAEVGIIAFLILGLIAGAIAKAVLPGDDPGGIIVTMLVGVVGALLGGLLAGVLFDTDPLDEFFDISTWLTAIVGSIVLLLLYRMVAGRRRT